MPPAGSLENVLICTTILPLLCSLGLVHDDWLNHTAGAKKEATIWSYEIAQGMLYMQLRHVTTGRSPPLLLLQNANVPFFFFFFF